MLNENATSKEVLDKNSFTVKLIDWGRAIDMSNFANKTFVGRAGTETFDCCEMLDGRPWTYQTDFFGFVSTLHVLLFGDYMNTMKDVGTDKYCIQSTVKRRLPQRDVLEDIFEMCLNIPDCQSFPLWSTIIQGLENNIDYCMKIDKLQWKTASREFNSALPLKRS
ncbi:hypothetical protein AB6A40_005713 [Gnathostoma spinigerum]|uniref:Protein kinase domain-containing protein n=1 Tax=Gnathostoma spinigerum TaxID=75299 RepID=A0ABD6EG90_9BILA